MAVVGSRIGFIWIYSLIVIFCVGIIELVIMPVIQHQLVPNLIMSMNMTSPADVVDYTAKVTQVVNFMHAMPYCVMFIVLVYMILAIFKKEETEIYYQP